MYFRKLNNATLWEKIQKLRKIIRFEHNFKQRTCWKCGRELNIYDFLSDNVELTPEYIMKLWQTPILEFHGFSSIPLLIAFILGINLGGNFLPQGSAADMMTLELSKVYCVDGMNYRKLLKIGGLFALLHIILGIGYLAIIIFIFF